MYKSQFRKIYPYDWFCDHMSYRIIKKEKYQIESTNPGIEHLQYLYLCIVNSHESSWSVSMSYLF